MYLRKKRKQRGHLVTFPVLPSYGVNRWRSEMLMGNGAMRLVTVYEHGYMVKCRLSLACVAEFYLLSREHVLALYNGQEVRDGARLFYPNHCQALDGKKVVP